MVRICEILSEHSWALRRADTTYYDGIDKDGPVVALFEQGEDERDGGRGEENNDKLVLELFQDEFVQRCWWVFGKSWRDGQQQFRARFSSSGIPLRPCFCLDSVTAALERPLSSCTSKCLSTAGADCTKALSMFNVSREGMEVVTSAVSSARCCT